MKTGTIAKDGYFYFGRGIISGGGGEYPIYTGTFNVTPTMDEQVLDTQNTTLLDNIKIHKIPFQQVTNTSGGTTVTIG